MSYNINQKLINLITQRNSKLIIGLDINTKKLPKIFDQNEKNIFLYAKKIIDNTYDLVIGYKINTSFYEAFGKSGNQLIYKINQYIKKKSEDLFIFADIKRGEIGEGITNLKKFYFDYLNFDYLMLVPWFGTDCFKELIKLENKGISIYLHDSNPSAFEIQDLKLKNNLPLYLHLIEFYKKIKLIPSNNIIFELGATFIEQLKMGRKYLGEEEIILTAGIGKQGGKIEDLRNVFGKNNTRLIVAISRSITFPDEIYKSKLKKKEIFSIIRSKAIFYKNSINKIANK